MPVPERLAERLAQEEPLLRQAFPEATIDSGALMVILHDYPLPAGWSHDHTDVLFACAAQLPRRAAGQRLRPPGPDPRRRATPGNSQGIQQHAGRSWLQFSYHIDPNDWRPHAAAAKGSNLADYLAGALSRFQEAS